MTAASMELAHAAEMTSAANTCSAEMTASSTGMRTTEACPAAVESTATAKMRAAAPATTAHMNAAAMSPTTMTTATWARVGCDGQSCQEGRRYDCDLKKCRMALRLTSENNVQTLNV